MRSVRREAETLRFSPLIRAATMVAMGGLSATTGLAQTAATATATPSHSLATMDAAESDEAAKDDILVISHRQHGAAQTDIAPQVTLDAAAIGALGAADLNEVFEDLAP